VISKAAAAAAAASTDEQLGQTVEFAPVLELVTVYDTGSGKLMFEGRGFGTGEPWEQKYPASQSPVTAVFAAPAQYRPGSHGVQSVKLAPPVVAR
jgi:hypothetical protein